MITIAICDDEKEICSKVESILSDYSTSKKIKIDISVFYSGQNLLEYIRHGNSFDLIFLDIEMEQLNGIEFGNALRSELVDDDTRIVYISWKQSYAMDLFRIRPYHFLIKPIEENVSAMEKIISDVNEELIKNRKFFHYQIGKTYSKEPYSNIRYFSSENRVVNIHTMSNDITFYGKLDDVELDTEGSVFLRVHKSLLINVKHVKRFEGKDVHMDNGEVLEISKKYKDAVNTFIMKNWGVY